MSNKWKWCVRIEAFAGESNEHKRERNIIEFDDDTWINNELVEAHLIRYNGRLKHSMKFEERNNIYFRFGFDSDRNRNRYSQKVGIIFELISMVPDIFICLCINGNI